MSSCFAAKAIILGIRLATCLPEKYRALLTGALRSYRTGEPMAANGDILQEFARYMLQQILPAEQKEAP